MSYTIKKVAIFTLCKCSNILGYLFSKPVNKPMPMGYQASKVGNLPPTFSNLLFIYMKGMKHVNTYCTKYFCHVVSFKPSSYSSPDKNTNGEKD